MSIKHWHFVYLFLTYNKLVNFSPVNLRAHHLIDESHPYPSLQTLLQHEVAVLLIWVSHRDGDVVTTWSKFTDLKMNQNVYLWIGVCWTGERERLTYLHIEKKNKTSWAQVYMHLWGESIKRCALNFNLLGGIKDSCFFWTYRNLYKLQRRQQRSWASIFLSQGWRPECEMIDSRI